MQSLKQMEKLLDSFLILSRSSFFPVMKMIISACIIIFGKAQAFGKSEEVAFARRENHQTNVYRMKLNDLKPILVFKSSELTNPNSLYPHWSKDGEIIIFTSFKGDNWKTFEFRLSDGSIKISDDPPRLNTQDSFAKELIVEAGSLYLQRNSGRKILLYKCQNFDRKTNPCVSEASWNFDKSSVVFQSCTFSLFKLNHESCDLYLVKSDASGLRKIGPGRHPQFRPIK